jgi:hypothetical protein
VSVARGVRHAQPTRLTHTRYGLGLGLAALLAGPAAAQDTAALLPLIDTYRDAPRQCDGNVHPAAGPMAPIALLAEVPVGTGRELMDVLKGKGYLAARAAMLSTAGVGSAEAVMRFLKARSRRTLLDPGFAEIGVGRLGERWRIVLARPLLSPEPPLWREAGQAGGRAPGAQVMHGRGWARTSLRARARPHRSARRGSPARTTASTS